jgi:hypothetical protein
LNTPAPADSATIELLVRRRSLGVGLIGVCHIDGVGLIGVCHIDGVCLIGVCHIDRVSLIGSDVDRDKVNTTV